VSSVLEKLYYHGLRLNCCGQDCIQGVSRLVDITAGGDFLGLCDQKSSYEHVSNFGRWNILCICILFV